MLAILVVLALVLLGAALGRRILLWCRVRFESLTEEFCFSVGIGLGAVSLAVMAAGLAGVLNSVPVGIGALVVVCLLIPDAVKLIAAAARKARSGGLLRRSFFQWILVLAIAASLALGFVSALAPPTARDTAADHLRIPLRYLARGAVYRLDDIRSNGPMNGVMLLIPAMGLGGDVAPALLHLAFMVIGGLALFTMSRRYLSKTGTLVAAATYFLMPITAALGPAPGMDFVLLAYVVLAFAAFVRWWEAERGAWLIVAAVCLGLAAGTEYTGLYAFVILFAGALVKALLRKAVRSSLLSHGAAAVLIAAAIGCPWYVRNAVLTGNPVYPALADVIPTRHITAAGKGRVQPVTVPRRYPPGLVNFVLFPVSHTLGMSRGVRAGPQAAGATQSPGPLLLALVPLLLVLRPVPRWAMLAVGFALCGFLLIVPLYPLPRHVLPFVVPCAVVAGYVFDRLSTRRWARWAMGAIVVVVLIVELLPFAVSAGDTFRVAAGLESREEYLLRVDDVYPMARHAAAVLPPGAKVLYVGERVYHFLRLGIDTAMGMPMGQAVVDFPAYETPAQSHRRLGELGFTHVVVNEQALEDRAPFALEMLRRLRGQGLVSIGAKGRLVLYKITPIPRGK